ncbi:MAG: sialidase family protein [Gemmatimonadales bacterium]
MSSALRTRKAVVAALAAAALTAGAMINTAVAQKPDPDRVIKGQVMKSLLSAGGYAALVGPEADAIGGTAKSGKQNGRGANALVNDACLDKAPGDIAGDAGANDRVTQSETEIAVLNAPGSVGKKMVAGYNDSYGFYDNTQGLSGYSYSTDGGKTWIDGGGLPPVGTTDQYFGDPLVATHNASQTFYYASIYQTAGGRSTLSVNRGKFAVAPPQGTESVANTLCLNNASRTGIPTAPVGQTERIIWEAPVDAIPTGGSYAPGDFADKEWLYVDQGTGTLYVTYTNFKANGDTPLELVRSRDGGQTWQGPFTIVPNLNDTFNQATQPITTPDGRLVVTWFSRTFSLVTGQLTSQRIETATSVDDGETFASRVTVANVNPQAEPRGYNRGRTTILNAPYIAAAKGNDDGIINAAEAAAPGFGNLYVTYFDGATFPASAPYSRSAEIHLSTSTDGGATWGPEVTVNDDATATSHVFPTVQAGKNGEVYVGWLDRRLDPVDNLLTDTWASVSADLGATFAPSVRQSDVSTGWFVRSDARPNFGDYNSSELIGGGQFVLIWADGRFRPGPAATAAGPNVPGTPDVYFFKAKGLGTP